MITYPLKQAAAVKLREVFFTWAKANLCDSCNEKYAENISSVGLRREWDF